MAAGKGTRMESHLPKVLVPVLGKPIIRHLINTVNEMDFTHPPIIVVGYEKEQVMAELADDNVLFAYQEEQLGTAHAVQCALPQIHPDVERVLIINGDHPFTPADMLQDLAASQEKNTGPLSLGTVTVNDSQEFQEQFYAMGRIIRDQSGNIINIIEKKDATAEQLAITEVSPQFWCINTKWLSSALLKIQNNNAAGEYYLPDLIKIAKSEGGSIAGYNTTNTSAAYGINTKQQLLNIEEKFKQHA
jgi:bifunctional UDP-N-acetylglucosamine pyrophosphorylase/glucosamine-1-phosphate N-acetyltransferase